MAGDLAFDADLRFKGEAYTEQFILDTSASYKVYKGQPMMIDANGDNENVIVFVDAFTVAVADICVGIAAEPHNVVAGDPEKEVVNVYTWPSIIGLKMASPTTYTNEDLGKAVLMSGSGLLSQTTLANVELGTVFAVEDGYLYIKLSTPKIQASSGA